MDVRYQIEDKKASEYTDNLINIVMKLALPEVDIDQYVQSCGGKSGSGRMNMSANDYAIKKASYFLQHSQPNEHKTKIIVATATTTSSGSNNPGLFSDQSLEIAAKNSNPDLKQETKDECALRKAMTTKPKSTGDLDSSLR